MEKLQKSGVLKNLGLDEKNTWILYDEAPRDFFEHLAANLDEANILTEIEYEQYKDLLVSSQFLEGDALTEELKELESQFPGILEINDDSIEELEQEFKQLESEQRDRVDRIARMEETVKQQRKYNAELEMKSFDLDYQEDQVTKECIEKVKKLSELQESNQLKIVQLTQTYMQLVSIKKTNFDQILTINSNNILFSKILQCYFISCLWNKISINANKFWVNWRCLSEWTSTSLTPVSAKGDNKNRH